MRIQKSGIKNRTGVNPVPRAAALLLAVLLCASCEPFGNVDTVIPGVSPDIYTIALMNGDHRLTLYAFTPVKAGDAAPSPLTVTVENTGTVSTGPLTISQDEAYTERQTHAPYFRVSDINSDIPPGGTATFTVQPAAKLPIGTYEAAITVSDDKNIRASFSVSFTVNSPTLILKNGDEPLVDYSFSPQNPGYTDQSGQGLSVNIQNTGGAPTGSLDISVSPADFEVNPAWVESVGAGETKSSAFTVKPKTGLSAGIHTATVMVKNSGLHAGFTVSFTVNTPHLVLEKNDGTTLTGHSFAAQNPGYALTDNIPLSVDIQNIGGAETGSLIVSVNSDDFEVNPAWVESIGAGKTKSSAFTVKPKTGLSSGTYTAVVTVKNSNDIKDSFIVSFMVRNSDPLSISYKKWGGSNLIDAIYTGNIISIAQESYTTTTPDNSWFVLDSNYSPSGGAVAITGDANIILKDGYTLSARVSCTGNLTIYQESANGSGKIESTASGGGISAGGNVTIHGGVFNLKPAADKPALSANDSVVIYGGNITAEAASGSNPGIVGDSVTIWGGTITKAQGAGSGAGIKGSNTVVIKGGTIVLAQGGATGAGIEGSNSVTISGAHILNAQGNGSGAGIDGGAMVIISGGEIGDDSSSDSTTGAKGGGAGGPGIKGTMVKISGGSIGSFKAKPSTDPRPDGAVGGGPGAGIEGRFIEISGNPLILAYGDQNAALENKGSGSGAGIGSSGGVGSASSAPVDITISGSPFIIARGGFTRDAGAGAGIGSGGVGPDSTGGSGKATITINGGRFGDSLEPNTFALQGGNQYSGTDHAGGGGAGIGSGGVVRGTSGEAIITITGSTVDVANVRGGNGSSGGGSFRSGGGAGIGSGGGGVYSNGSSPGNSGRVSININVPVTAFRSGGIRGGQSFKCWGAGIGSGGAGVGTSSGMAGDAGITGDYGSLTTGIGGQIITGSGDCTHPAVPIGKGGDDL